MADMKRQNTILFNECFTRKILPEKRPVEYSSDAFISPRDSRLSGFIGLMKSQLLILREVSQKWQILIPDSKKAPDYNGGICMVFRLCVDDYHKMAMLTMARLWKISRLREYHTVRLHCRK